MKVTVKIDPNECIAAANCVGVSEKFFKIAAEPYAELLDRNGQLAGTEHTYDLSSAELDLMHEAAESCPTRAITVIES